MNIPKIVFVVPYRNRESEKTHFSVYMKYLMEDCDVNDYEIYYSHQIDKRPFNRGATKNIGFLALKKKYPADYKNITFVFNDVDTLPAKKNSFDYATTHGIVKHFYGFTFALGGIFSITGADFEKCNGFPNNWGWGLEDNEMQNRVKANNFTIDRTQFCAIGSRDVIQIHDSPMRLINNKDPGRSMEHKLIDNLDKISELEYNIESVSTKNTQEDEDAQNDMEIQEDARREYMINITNFKTFINPANEIFYSQNTFFHAKLKKNQYEKTVTRERWALNKFFK
jgi:hypothetical protein